MGGGLVERRVGGARAVPCLGSIGVVAALYLHSTHAISHRPWSADALTFVSASPSEVQKGRETVCTHSEAAPLSSEQKQCAPHCDPLQFYHLRYFLPRPPLQAKPGWMSYGGMDYEQSTGLYTPFPTIEVSNRKGGRRKKCCGVSFFGAPGFQYN